MSDDQGKDRIFIKMEWATFIEQAMANIRRQFPGAGEPKFMVKNGYEADGDMYAYPNYVLIDILGGNELGVAASPEANKP